MCRQGTYPRGSTLPLREGQVLVWRLVVVLLVVGCVSQNVARLALSDAYRGRQLFLLDRHRLRILVLPLVHGAAPGVHEEIADRRRFQAQLPRDCHLHLLRRPLGLLRTQNFRDVNIYLFNPVVICIPIYIGVYFLLRVYINFFLYFDMRNTP